MRIERRNQTRGNAPQGMCEAAHAIKARFTQGGCLLVTIHRPKLLQSSAFRLLTHIRMRDGMDGALMAAAVLDPGGFLNPGGLLNTRY